MNMNSIFFSEGKLFYLSYDAILMQRYSIMEKLKNAFIHNSVIYMDFNGLSMAESINVRKK